MKLTEKEAYHQAYKLWSWLAETGTIGKSEWPGWNGSAFKEYASLVKIESYCPLCLYYYAHEASGPDCDRCLDVNKGIWKCVPSNQAAYCENSKSTYWEWLICGEKGERKVHAKKMADHFLKVYKAMDFSEKKK